MKYKALCSFAKRTNIEVTCFIQLLMKEAETIAGESHRLNTLLLQKVRDQLPDLGDR